MPDTQNSYYPAWKIWFEKYFQYLGENKLIVIGHSLGGIFLAKYLSENKFPRCIDSLHLVSPVYNNE
jgi:predicted alpha/beta hydrolase family esterase